MYTYTHTQTHTHTHKHTHTRTHACTHKHGTHTHTHRACSSRKEEYCGSWLTRGLMTGASISRAEASRLFLSSCAHTSSQSRARALPRPDPDTVTLLMLTDWPLWSWRILAPRSTLRSLWWGSVCQHVCLCSCAGMDSCQLYSARLIIQSPTS